MLAAALLHDVGKTDSGLRTYGRVVATLSAAVAGHDAAHAWSQRRGFTRKVGLYLRHAELGADQLALAGSDPLTVAWAREHHDPPERWTVPRPHRRRPQSRRRRLNAPLAGSRLCVGRTRSAPLLRLRLAARRLTSARCPLRWGVKDSYWAGGRGRRRRGRGPWCAAAISWALAAPIGEHLGNAARVVAQLAVALLHGAQQLDDGGGGVGLERAVLACTAPARPPGARRCTPPGSTAGSTRPGLASGSKRTSPSVSVTARLILRSIAVGVVEQQHGALRRLRRLRHLRRRVLEVHDPGADRGDDVLGHDERVAVAAVEALGDVAGQLEVLALVVADRHLVGVVEEDVGGLERRVGEQPGRHELGPVGLVLELRHAPQLAERWRCTP